MAETPDIALVPAARSPRRGFALRMLAEAFDELPSIVERGAAVDEGRVHATFIATVGCASPHEIGERDIDHGAWQSTLPSAMAIAMNRPTSRAGGCFLTLFILLGFLGGLAIRNPMKGVLIGTAVGAALATLVWLLDRRRR
jgi:hypothetical protein